MGFFLRLSNHHPILKLLESSLEGMHLLPPHVRLSPQSYGGHVDAPHHPLVEVSRGHRAAVNTGTAPFVFDLSTLRGAGDDGSGGWPGAAP